MPPLCSPLSRTQSLCPQILYLLVDIAVALPILAPVLDALRPSLARPVADSFFGEFADFFEVSAAAPAPLAPLSA